VNVRCCHFSNGLARGFRRDVLDLKRSRWDDARALHLARVNGLLQGDDRLCRATCRHQRRVARFKKLAADGKVRLRRRHHRYTIHFVDPFFVVGGQPGFWHPQLPRGLQSPGIDFRDMKLDRHGL